ncbi:MAG: hypothetical protein JXL97_07750 [Bacteroidales bacterium]|nr:hypothetical protein [Bacteroidales bacterium]
MIKNKDIFFITSAWNTGTGFIVKDYNFIITTIQVVGFSKKVVIRNNKIGKHLVKVIFIDYSNGLVFIELPESIKSNFNIINFELAVVEQPVKIFRTNYKNEIVAHTAEITNNSYQYNNFNHLLIKYKDHLKISGGVIVNNRNEIVGISKFLENENLFLGLPAKYILKSMEEFSMVQDISVRCPNCQNIVKKSLIEDNFCPSCTAEIKDELLEDFIPQLTLVESNIERALKKLGYKIELARLGRSFWEINEGSATIFIRYEQKHKFIVAFSNVISLNGHNKNEVNKFLLVENSKIGDLSFSINDNKVYLSAPYIFDDDFCEEYAETIFKDLFKKADFYDDIIENIQNKTISN